MNDGSLQSHDMDIGNISVKNILSVQACEQLNRLGLHSFVEINTPARFLSCEEVSEQK